MSSSATAASDQAIRALEGWVEVYDSVVEKGGDYDRAVATADEWARVAGPAYPRPAGSLASLNDILKEYYLPSTEPGAVYEYDPYSDTYTMPNRQRITRHGMKQRHSLR